MSFFSHHYVTSDHQVLSVAHAVQCIPIHQK